MFVYKAQELGLIKDSTSRRMLFAHHFEGGIKYVVDNIWFTDESIFTLNHYVIKQNDTSWYKKGENPQEPRIYL